MWETKIGRSIQRHFLAHESEDLLVLRCLRCRAPLEFSARTPLIFTLIEATYHLQHFHGFPGAAGGWQGYLDDLPAPPNPS